MRIKTSSCYLNPDCLLRFSGFNVYRYDHVSCRSGLFVDAQSNYAVFSIANCDDIEGGRYGDRAIHQGIIEPTHKNMRLLLDSGTVGSLIVVELFPLFFARDFSHWYAGARCRLKFLYKESFGCDELVSCVFRQLLAMPVSSSLYHELQIKVLLRYIFRRYFCRFQPMEEVSVNWCVHSCLEYLHNNYNMNFTVQDVADKCGVDQAKLSRDFKRDLGSSINQYLNTYRVKKAKKLLLELPNVIDVAYEVGYQNPAYFSQQFKRVTGVSPSEYKMSKKDGYRESGDRS